ncbi:MAG: protoheme IX farnesyltransferase [Bacteroidales bacterium]|nr:protoheme IX farnesyltransferase [Bacteroidales bacterium]
MLKTILELSKIKITFAVMLTTITGYVLAANEFNKEMIATVLGLFVLACGSAIINQYQEYKTDAVMNRTSKRPIPAGKISPKGALSLGIGFSLLGSATILINSGWLAMSLGLAALVWYNFIYTPLKKITPFAVIPGSVIGALPPLVGWVAGGGEISDPRALIMAFFFFIWQVPHFWLLMLKYGQDYEAAGYPSLHRFYSENHIKRVTFLWTVSTAIAALMLPVFNVVDSSTASYAILILSFWLIFAFLKLLKLNSPSFKPMSYFMKINIYVLFIIIIITVDGFTR